MNISGIKLHPRKSCVNSARPSCNVVTTFKVNFEYAWLSSSLRKAIVRLTQESIYL